jgi:signal transduction histidine kinase
MKLDIRSRLTIQFSYIVTLIITFFSAGIYWFSAQYRASEFNSRLENRAFTIAGFMVRGKGMDYNSLNIINVNTKTLLFDEKVMIYDDNNKLVYMNTEGEAPEVPRSLLDDIRKRGKVNFKEKSREGIGLLVAEKEGRMVVIASAFDFYGWRKLRFLKWILLVGFVISIALTVFTGNIFARRALKPMSDIVKQVDRITAEILHSRVSEGNRTDEIAKLAITFNRMLGRLESAFEMQKSFVSNASHELRTPLTSVTGQIEVALLKSRSTGEYQAILSSVLEDIRGLNELSNGLLDLAKVSSDASVIDLHPLRIDDILWESRDDLLKRDRTFSVSISFSETIGDERELTVLGNHQLLKTALLNLMENGCKFSPDKSVEVGLWVREAEVEIRFADKGTGIDKEDLGKVFHPFFRAENVKNIHGSGLGLPLTERIVSLHQG